MRGVARWLVPAVLALGLGGCATPGALHFFSATPPAPSFIHDSGADAAAADFPSYVAPHETLVGFAYDPFTDHFFLRLAPGDYFRVVDRPGRRIKRGFFIPTLKTTGGADLAIRPRDGHVFAAHPSEAAVVEFTRYGELVRTLPLEGLQGPPAALAFDTDRDRLVVLGGRPAVVTIHDLAGHRLAILTPEREIAGECLAYDAEKHELYAALAREGPIGIFDETGRLIRTLPWPAPAPGKGPLFDVGPRSFLRLF